MDWCSCIDASAFIRGFDCAGIERSFDGDFSKLRKPKPIFAPEQLIFSIKGHVPVQKMLSIVHHAQSDWSDSERIVRQLDAE